MSSNQVAVFVPVTVSLPFASVTRQRHQSCAPGGSDPLWRISHVHSALTVLPGMNCGKAFAITSPQVCCSFPYSNTTDVISTSLVIVAWKVADSGKLRIISLLVTLGSKEEKADVRDNRLRLTQSVSAMFNFRMKTLLSNVGVDLAKASLWRHLPAFSLHKCNKTFARLYFSKCITRKILPSNSFSIESTPFDACILLHV